MVGSTNMGFHGMCLHYMQYVFQYVFQYEDMYSNFLEQTHTVPTGYSIKQLQIVVFPILQVCEGHEFMPPFQYDLPSSNAVCLQILIFHILGQ